LDAGSTQAAYAREMESNASRVEHLFIVRVWYERRGEQTSHWRGSVEHVPSSTRYYFSEFRALADFVAANSGVGAGGEKARP
jgi:hypothetical protein